MYVVLGSSETLVKPLLSKALESMVNEAVDEQLNDTELSELHTRKACSPILVTEAGMVIDVKPLPSKAYQPILVTEAGMVIDVRPELSKALLPMLVS